MTQGPIPAPELKVQKWLNTDQHLRLESLRGRVVAIFAFQMLCPACVSENIEDNPIPQTMREYQTGGTPSLLLIDRQGNLRKHKMGHEDDLVLGAELMSLLNET